MQYLHRVEELFQEDRWEWREQKDGAFRFPSYEAAENARTAHRYEDSKGKPHLPFPLVVPAKDASEPVPVPTAVEGRAKSSPKSIEERAAIGRKASRAHFLRKRAQQISSEEAFEHLEARRLA